MRRRSHRRAAVWPALFGWVALLCLATAGPLAAADSAPLVSAVRSVGVTVADLERSVAFYRDVLDFRPVGEFEVAGDEYEQLYGVFGLRIRVARLALGTETLELMQFLAPAGRPIPVDSRGNMPAGARPSTSGIRTGTIWKSGSFRRARAPPSGTRRPDSRCFSASITRLSWLPTRRRAWATTEMYSGWKWQV